MPRDLFTERRRCSYCGRPGSLTWDDDLFSCGEEVCQGLAFAEAQRRRRVLSRRGTAGRPRSTGPSAPARA